MKKFFRRPWLIVAVITLITLFFAIQLPRARLDNNNLRFVPNDDAALKVSEYITDAFGSSLFILVGLERKYGTVFDGPFLNRIREYVDRVEEIEIVNTVSSIVTADYITSDGDAIVAKKLVDAGFSGTPEEIAELKRRILSWDMYKKSLVSDDFTATQILIPLSIESDDAGRPEVIDNFVVIRDAAKEMFSGMADVYVTGMPVISATINEAVSQDLILLVPLVIIVVLAILFFSFRRFSSVFLPLLTVVIASTWAIGAMPLFGIKLSIITTVLPVILVAVGSAYGIHVITHYRSDVGNRMLNAEEHRELIYELIRKIGKPVFLAALTTFVGFFSCCFTRVVPIREFGIFSSFGVIAAFVVSLTLIPSLLLIQGPRKIKPRFKANAFKANAAGEDNDRNAAGEEREEIDPLSNAIAEGFTAIVRKKRFVVIFSVLIVFVSLYGFSKVIIDNVMVEYFKTGTDINKSDRFIRDKFGGSKVVNLMVEAPDSETLLHPDVLSAIDGLDRYLTKNVSEVGKVMGFTNLVKRMNQVFNADESPEGLKKTGASSQVSEEEGRGDFGFADDDTDFGFGFDAEDGFGFGDFGLIEDSVPVIAESAGKEGERGGETYLSDKELTALLERASEASLGMDANDLVWELKRLLNYEGTSYYEIPSDLKRYGKNSPEELQRLVSNYLVLLSGSISDYANDPLEPTAIKSTVQLRTLGKEDTDIALKEMQNYINANFPKNVKTTIGGVSMVEASLNDLVVQSQLISVIISLLLVFIIIAASNRSFVAGVVGIVPLSISILINFAVMGFTGIKLNIGTVMVASVSVGIGIDYTIHYMDAYKREYRASLGKGDFLKKTYLTSGKAIIINAVSVGAGFSVLLLSQFNILADLGFLIALTMGTSALVSLTLIPVLLTLIKPEFIKN
ncbi:MAG: MMPL family transporter [Treponema sp.]|jgi:predicted RND superfamily exporter protein|nr:MMPL family transporter [Treponema sp.]